MTTIAYKKGVFSADGRLTTGWVVLSEETKKLHRLLDGGVAALAGFSAYSLEYVDWLNGDLKVPRPIFKNDEHTSTQVLVARPGRVLELHTALAIEPIYADVFALGSGREFALAALDLGFSTGDAVKAAAKRDIATGGKITTMQVSRYRATR